MVIEFLRCISVSPFKSHPNRYWQNLDPDKKSNWRKFTSIWAVTQALGGQLWLVNYHDAREEFSIIHVKDLMPGEAGRIVTEEREDCDFKRFKQWYQDVNDRAGGLW